MYLWHLWTTKADKRTEGITYLEIDSHSQQQKYGIVSELSKHSVKECL